MNEKIVKSYECENMLNSNRQMDSNIIQFAPIPTAPLVESREDSPYSIQVVRNPPPYSPPLPPHSEYAEPFLTRISRQANEKSRHLRRCDANIVFKVALFEGLIAAFMLAGGIWCLINSSEYCPYYSAIWTSAVFAVNALVGIAAAKRCTVNLFVAYLVLSLISLMLCAISGAVSASNWLLIGTYRHPKIDRNQAFCLIGEYDASRARYILTEMNRYDFRQCLSQLKIGVSINSIQFIIAIIEGSVLTFPYFIFIFKIII
uniref:MARVEL domain-containing protein n=1 Tax=Elaeophora elaphi TaxID=1147741 RepID=A0A0R3S249_9BILA